jgi:hypothetical protein
MVKKGGHGIVTGLSGGLGKRMFRDVAGWVLSLPGMVDRVVGERTGHFFEACNSQPEPAYLHGCRLSGQYFSERPCTLFRALRKWFVFSPNDTRDFLPKHGVLV